MTELSMSTSALLWTNIRQALRVNLYSALVLQAFAVAIAVSYFQVQQVQALFDQVADFKQQTGIAYSIVSTALFGGVLPFLYLWLSGQIASHFKRQLLFYLVLWSFMGAVVDSFYQFQSVLFGNENDWGTIVKKTAFDQFVFSALITCPFITVIYLWKDQGFSWQLTRQKMDMTLFRLMLPTTIITNWLVWIPAVSVIYLMPSALQIPLFNLVLCFFVLLLAVLKR